MKDKRTITSPYYVIANNGGVNLVMEKQDFYSACEAYRSLRQIYGDNISITGTVIKNGEEI